MPEDLTFEEYISFGKYNADEENDGLGIDDFEIFAYVEDLTELERLRTAETFDWRLVDILEVHYA